MQWTHHERLDSTQTHAARAAAGWADAMNDIDPAPVLISADEQTGGRGRHNRAWVSPAGGAYFSICYPWKSDAATDASVVPLCVGSAVRDVLVASDPRLEHRLQIKWPNDILCDGAKLAGVLCEQQFAAGRAQPHQAIIIGVGINVSGAADRLGPCRLPAITLEQATGTTLPTRLLIRKTAQRIVDRLDAAVEARWSAEHISHCLAFSGACVAWRQGGERHTGTLTGIAPDGALLIHTSQGPRRVTAGEVDGLTHLPDLAQA